MEIYKDRDWLYQKYIIEQKNCTEIGREVSRDPKTVWQWLKNNKIQTRKRGADSSPGTFKKNHKYGVGRIQSEVTREKIRQARIKDGHVPYLKDGIHWLKHEGAISPNYQGGVTPMRQQIYSSEEWARCVREVWIRDKYTCQDCGLNQNDNKNISFHIHHIKSFAKYPHLRTETKNLILLCPQCHNKRHRTRK